jgi:hypothetical protein
MREPASVGVHMVYWLIMIVLLVIAVGSSLSQPPAPPGYGTHQAETNQSRNSGNQENKSRETFWQRTFSDPTAFFTFVLAVFTCVLAVSTFFLWLVTGTAARAALRSADVAERALTDLERPFLLPSLPPVVFEARRDQRNREFLRYGFCNYGRTPAIITHRDAKCVITDSPLEIPDISESTVPNLVLAPGEKYKWEYADLIRISFNDISNIIIPSDGNHVSLSPSLPAGKDMYFFIFIRYVDIFKRSHDTLRCWKYDRLAFRPHEGEDYNRTT